jgi:hypothetical protein
MAVRQIEKLGRAANRAGLPHRLQQIHEGVAQRALAVARSLHPRRNPLVRKIDVLHGLSLPDADVLTWRYPKQKAPKGLLWCMQEGLDYSLADCM